MHLEFPAQSLIPDKYWRFKSVESPGQLIKLNGFLEKQPAHDTNAESLFYFNSCLFSCCSPCTILKEEISLVGHVSYRWQFEHFHFSSSSRLHWPAIGRLPTQIKSVFTLKHFFPCVEKSPEAFDRAAVAVQSNLFCYNEILGLRWKSLGLCDGRWSSVRVTNV